MTWDLPELTPGGITMTVSGTHSDLQTCSGSISVKLDGGLMDSPTGMASAALTVLTGLGVLFSAVPRKPF